jgi:hypothetical protein
MGRGTAGAAAFTSQVTSIVARICLIRCMDGGTIGLAIRIRVCSMWVSWLIIASKGLAR